MGENIITFNVPNLVTIGVMALVVFSAFGMLAQFWHNRNGMAA